jgi:ribonuclease R
MKKEEIQQRVRGILSRLKRPATEKDLLKHLRVKGESKAVAKQVLEEMVSRGDLARTRTGRLGLPEKMDLVAGRLECKPGGFGFVRPDQRGEPDIYVAGAGLGEALHGDRVLVHIERRVTDGKREGRVVEILARATNRMVGRYEKDSEGSRVVPFDPHFLYEVFITPGEEGGAEAGEMVVVELTRFPGPFRAPAGRIVEVLGRVNEPGVDTAVIIAKYGIPEVFPQDVILEAESVPSVVDASALAGRTDFRDRAIVTIDGETARDFDDAVRVEMLANGNYLLGVHIADVSHYVREGSRLDGEARERGNSVYFPERAVPMLPERLSNGICSLNPGVDRLVQSVLIEINPQGRIVNYDLHDGVIRSSARMTYTEVRQILVDRDPEVRKLYEELVPIFEKMLELYQILRARREKRGSIDFDLPEPEILLDLEGVMTGVIAAERNVAHRIIEEFMLLANDVVAEHLARLEVPSLYRVHDPPDADRIESFEDLILGFGYRLRASTEQLKPKNFQKLIKKIEGKPEERLISYLMLRAMRQALYSKDNTGHYALAAPTYTHFTSPIRRYPDLVVHRLLREVRSTGVPSIDEQEEREKVLPLIAEHSSTTERRAEDAERELVEWKKVRFMADKLGDVLTGYITAVTSYGLFVELEEYFVEGLIHISTLADDYYHFNEKRHTLRGESTGKLFRLGDRLEVQVVRVDLERRQIDFSIEDLAPSRRRGKAKDRSAKRGREARRQASRARKSKPS